MQITHEHWHLPEKLLQAKVSFFPAVRAPRPVQELTIGELLAGVKDGEWRAQVEAVREANKVIKAKAEELKLKLPAVKLSGTFAGLRAASLIQHSRVLCLDFDKVGDGLAQLAERLRADPHVLAFFISCSGTGLKVLVAIKATDRSTHDLCAKAALRHFLPLLGAGGKLDPAPTNVASNCFVSWDDQLYVGTTPVLAFTPAEATPGPRPATPEGEEEEEISSGVSGGSEGSEGSVRSISQVSAARARRKEAERKLRHLADHNPYLSRVYVQYLGGRAVVRGQRHNFLTKAVPALFGVVSEAILIQFLMLHYDANEGIWLTSRSDHQDEVVSMIKTFASDYTARLSAGERLHYAALDTEMERAAFRVCRDLSKTQASSKSQHPGSFYLSCRELGTRLGLKDEQAHRILKGFYADGIINRLINGLVWATGTKPTATTWEWTADRVVAMAGSKESGGPGRGDP